MKVSDGWSNAWDFIDVVYGFWCIGVSGHDFCTWFTIVELVGIEYRGFIDCCTSILFNIRVSVLRLMMLTFNGMIHSLSTGHHQNFNTDASDILSWRFVHHICLPHLHQRLICSHH